MSFEEVVRLQPDYIVFASNHAGFEAEELGSLRSRGSGSNFARWSWGTSR